MRRVIFSLVGVLVLVYMGLQISEWRASKNHIAELRKQHEAFLRNSPFKETLKLTKVERKAKGIPPNKYLEREWELTMNPATGKPEPEKLFELQETLRSNNAKAIASKLPGEKDNDWEERGPDNVGGRTRAIMFDPNDTNHTRVFAGGVSGGLWVNDDITDVNSAWTEVDMPQNLAISCITYDPNDTMTFYVGTGESYVFGAVNGNGVWKSTDGGVNWARVFGGADGDTNVIAGSSNTFNVRLTVNSPGSIAGDYFGQRAAFGESLTSLTGDLVLADDGTAAPTEACNSLTNGGAINGNIAVIVRGDCDFSQKMLNAQDAGAIAVVMVNNVAGDPITMGAGTSAELVTIPSLMLSMTDGQSIIDQLGSGVNITMNGYSNYSGYTARAGVQHINDIKIRDIGGGNSEVYVAAGSTFFGDTSPSIFLGPEDYGLYKSTDAGTSWSRLTLPSYASANDYELQPNDIEISADNTIWVSTRGDLFSDGGGEIISSADGVSFSLEYKVSSGDRTQIAVSSTNANSIYVLSELKLDTPTVSIIYTDDAFSTISNLSLPVDVDTDIGSDFTFGQGFYNLLLEVDPTNDDIVYVGGIDLFRSDDGGMNWSQISEYYTSNVSISDVHPDQHALVFHPTDNTKAVMGNDGGVYYGTSLTTTPSIVARNKNYNTLQFYNGAIGQDAGAEKLLSGSQDNGSQFINNASNGINSSTQVTGGDGAYVFIDRDGEYIVTSSQNGNYYYRDYATGTSSGYTIDGDSNGAEFINPTELDSDSNTLFSSGVGSINRYKLNVGASNNDSFTDAAITATTVTALKASPYSSNTLFVGTENGRLFKVTLTHRPAGSQVWTEITDSNFIGSISCVELGTSDDDIYVSFHNYGVSNVFHTNDGGTTWLDKEGDLPDLPVKAIMPNPLNANEVILGTDLGIWATPNFGDANPNWYQAQNGMKDVKVTSFDLRTSDNTVLASTYGRGMFTGLFTAASSTLSTKDAVFNKAIKIYPTVSSGSFSVASNKTLEKGTIGIFDMNGKEVYHSKMDFNAHTAQHVTINVSSGLYLVTLTSGNLKATRKIIIK